MDERQASELLGALAQETRLLLFRKLIAQGATGASAGDIAQSLRVPASTMSFHLSALERSGLLLATRQGRNIIYAVQLSRLRELLTYLTEACCEGEPAQCGDLGHLLPRSIWEIPMTPAFNVLFLCTANSARSVMAEAILAKLGGGRFNAFSAGSAPAARPLPEVVAKLETLGHDVSGLRSKSWDEFTGPDAPRMDFVIALCDTLHGQACPDFGERAVTGAWPLPDPTKFSGSDAERQIFLNELYASLRRRIEIFTALPFATLDRMAVKARLDELGVPVGA